MTSEDELKRIRYGLGVGLVLMAALTLSQIVVLFSGPSNLVDTWEIRLIDDSVTIGEPIQLEGRFVCTDAAIDADPQVQFTSALSEDGVGGWTVARPTNPAFNLARACGTGEWVPFEYPWDAGTSDGVASVAEPGDEIEIRITVEPVSPEAWVGATVVSNAAPLNP